MQNSPTNIFSIIRYIRNRYFIHQVIKGIIYFFISFIISFSILILFDLSFSFSNSSLFYLKNLYVFFLIIILFYFTFLPLFFWITNKGKYNYIWFAQQIGNKIPEIDDKLVNIIELHQFAENSNLVTASIYQKLENIDVKQIKSFYSIKDLYKGFLLLFLFLSIFGLITFLIPDAIKYSSTRLLPFYKQKNSFLFDINIENETLIVDKGSSFNLIVSINGKFRPNELYIHYGNSNYLMTDSSGFYIHKFFNVRKSLNFSFKTQEFSSTNFSLHCIPIPSINNINLTIQPPQYTLIESSYLANRGNASVPYGSTVSWDMSFNDTDSLFFISDTSKTILSNIDGVYRINKRIFKDFSYSIIPVNTLNTHIDTFNFKINVQQDFFPKIQLVNNKIDDLGNFIFSGFIDDDYGIHQFQVVFENTQSSFKLPLPFDKNSLEQSFYYEGHLNDLIDSVIGNYVEIYLQVFDNDPFYPYKSAKSFKLYANFLNSKELSQIEQKKFKEVRDKLSFGRDILKELKKQKAEIKNKLLSENLSQWEKNQMMDNMKNITSEMQKVSDDINQLREELKQIPNQSLSTDLQEKRDLLNKLLSQLMDKELSQMLEELKQLQEKLKKDVDLKNLDNIDFSLDDMEKQLDRNLEMLKRYDIEKGIEEIVKDLKELSKQYKSIDSLTSQSKIDSLNSELQNQFEKHNDVIKKNKELESSLDIDSFDKEKKNLLQKSEDFKSGKPSKSSNPSDDIKKLASKMESNMADAMAKDQAESEELIREILENTLLFSFEQESLIKRFQNNSRPDNNMKREQSQLNERFNILEDSLQALMLRNIELSSFVGGLLKDINFHFSTIKKRFSEDFYKSISVHQQSIMKSVNDLVLMLQESLNNNDNNMSGQGGNCKKKGKNKKPGMGSMKKQQQSFKKAVQDMIDGLKKGKKEGKGKNGMSKQLSKMLGEQEKMQQMLQQLMQSDDVGQKSSKLLKEIGKLLDKNIDDIINRNIGDQLINRQNLILNRMLEAEKAEKERDKDNKRESEVPNNIKISNPKSKLEYKEKNNIQKGIMVKPNIPLKYFFQRKYDIYLNKMEKN